MQSEVTGAFAFEEDNLKYEPLPKRMTPILSFHKVLGCFSISLETVGACRSFRKYVFNMNPKYIPILSYKSSSSCKSLLCYESAEKMCVIAYIFTKCFI